MSSITGTKEWAGKNINIQTGCEHECRYCYAKSMALRFSRVEACNWKTTIIDRKKVEKGYSKYKGTVMFPSTHDITPANVEECLVVLDKLLRSGNRVLIVSKPHLDCVKLLCQKLSDYKTQILFRFTIGSADDELLSYWEPMAPKFNERIASLEHAFTQGFQTSVSSEPMLDRHIDIVIDKARPFVTDAIWLGAANRLANIIPRNCPGDQEALRKAAELKQLIDTTYIHGLYARYKEDPIIKWKDTLKKVLGIPASEEPGLDQ